MRLISSPTSHDNLFVVMTTSLPWHPLLPTNSQKLHHHHTNSQKLHSHHTNTRLVVSRHVFRVKAFRRSDFDDFGKRMASGEAWRDAWRSANDGFEQFIYETKKTAERIDRQYSVSRRFSAAAQSAVYRAKELDRDLEITQRWRSFTLDFSRDWPRYRKKLIDLVDTPLGRSFATIFFLWFALSGWLFRIVIFATWVLPFAGPLLIGAVANNLVIQGSCPACKKQFVGSKTQTVRCSGCGNIVWQPQGNSNPFSGGSGGTPRSSKSESDIIDVEFEEK